MQVLQVILKWVRANVYTVICAAVMIAAPAALWFFSGKMNAEVRKEVQNRADKMGALGKFETTSVALESPVPGNEPVSGRIAVNRRFLDRYQEVVGKLRDDAKLIREEVLKINCKGRGVLNDKLFPSPDPKQREVLPKEMHRQLITAYEKLLNDVRAGSPPSAEQMEDVLRQARERYLSTVLKRSTEGLSPQDQADLTEQLSRARTSFCADAARAISMYATMADLNVPGESQRPVRAEGQGLVDMFQWQWQFWIKEDVLRALAEANHDYPSVVEAPVKRVKSIAIAAPPAAAAVAGGDSDSESGSGGGFAAPSGGFAAPPGGQSGGGAGAAAAVVVADPSQEVPADYSISFTGRHTNPLFDVYFVRVDLIVDSARIPAVFDALAQQNFMTVVDAQVESGDLFEALRDSYFYGAAPVSRLTLTVESVWLREWTSQFMPLELKQALGIPATPPPGNSGTPGNG